MKLVEARLGSGKMEFLRRPCPASLIRKRAVVGAAAVVTKDVPDYAVAVGNPAQVIKYLDASRFHDEV